MLGDHDVVSCVHTTSGTEISQEASTLFLLDDMSLPAEQKLLHVQQACKERTYEGPSLTIPRNCVVEEIKHTTSLEHCSRKP